MTLREQQKAEAIRRLHLLNIMPQVIDEFIENDKVEYSERTDIQFEIGEMLTFGTLFYIDNIPEFSDIVKDFEKRTGALVYHATHEHTVFGELLDLLYVSSEEDEWDMEIVNKKLHEGDKTYIYAKVINLTNDTWSDYGTIAVSSRGGGLVREE